LSHETWMIIAACLLALAVLLAIAAVVVYYRLDIREVRDFRSGKAASREIQELRSIRAGSWRAGILANQPEDTASDPTDSSDLHFRSIKAPAQHQPLVSTDEAVTTLRVVDAPQETAPPMVDELPTTLTPDVRPLPASAHDADELPTTLKTDSRSR